MSEASELWYERVDKAVRDLNQVLEDHRRLLLEQAALRAELRLALFKAHVAKRPVAAAIIDNPKPLRKAAKPAAASALVFGSASYMQA